MPASDSHPSRETPLLPGYPVRPGGNRAGAKTLVLGLGNELLSDDAIGLRVTTGLRHRLAGRENLTFVESPEAGLALLDQAAGFEVLVVLDAVQTGRCAPGLVHEFTLSELPLAAGVSPHCLGLGEVLALGRELGLPVPSRVLIFAIEVQDPFTLGERMSPALTAAQPAMVAQIAARLEELAGEPVRVPGRSTPVFGSTP